MTTDLARLDATAQAALIREGKASPRELVEAAIERLEKIDPQLNAVIRPRLEKARAEYRVGNLYLNRSITGALVGRPPFGGFGMSGIGSKAGGVDYLRQFVEPRAVTENTMRRGFAPGR